MAPLRRYLRITKHSVLEVRIYLDRPADGESWLLRQNDPALPRIIQAIRPLILPKLREENVKGKGRSGTKAKKKNVKDVVIEDDFEVSIFFTDLSSRHTVLTKRKVFKDKARIRSNSKKLTDWLATGTNDQPIVINNEATDSIVIREEYDKQEISLADIPEAAPQHDQPVRATRKKPKPAYTTYDQAELSCESEDSLVLVPDSRNETSKGTKKTDSIAFDEQEQADGKEKTDLITSYDGFSIYGRILCLVVKRKGSKVGAPSSQAMLENWVATQASAEPVDDDEDIS